MTRRVLVGLSGGIDSAVAAYLLKCRGFQVEGVFMHNWDARIEDGQYCTVEEDFGSAQKICNLLRIPLRRTNFVREYWNHVFVPALRAYKSGCTPNPDILCNREIKLGRLLDWSIREGYDFLATGHYAQITHWRNSHVLAQARSLAKDQSYFLADVPRERLARLLLPIGGLESKNQVRQIAQEHGLDFLLKRPESMGVCFVGRRRKFSHFLGQFHLQRLLPVFDMDEGMEIGQSHSFVTLGERLRIAGLAKAAFCVKKDKDRIFASPNRHHPLLRPAEIQVNGLSHLNDLQELVSKTEQGILTCAIRSAEKEGVPIESITPSHNGIVLVGQTPFHAPAPGQNAVFYWQPENTAQRLVVDCGIITD